MNVVGGSMTYAIVVIVPIIVIGVLMWINRK